MDEFLYWRDQSVIERLLVNREELESVTDICDFTTWYRHYSTRILKHDSIEDQFRKISRLWRHEHNRELLATEESAI